MRVAGASCLLDHMSWTGTAPEPSARSTSRKTRGRLMPASTTIFSVWCLMAHTGIRGRVGITARAKGPRGRKGRMGERAHGERAAGAARLGDQVQGGADDAVGVDAVVAVQVLDRPGLAELRHAQRGVRHPVDGGQERQRVRVPVQDGDQRRGAGRGERLVEDPGLAGARPAPGPAGRAARGTAARGWSRRPRWPACRSRPAARRRPAPRARPRPSPRSSRPGPRRRL